MDNQELRQWIRMRLSELRAARMRSESPGLSVKQFARLAGMSPRHVYKIEAGESSPTIETLNNWLAACNSSLGQFFTALQASEATNRQRRAEDEAIESLRRGFMFPLTRKIVLDSAATVREYLEVVKPTRLRGKP
jgi:transcriptional regulator with XRE-family HTH domain